MTIDEFMVGCKNRNIKAKLVLNGRPSTLHDIFLYEVSVSVHDLHTSGSRTDFFLKVEGLRSDSIELYLDRAMSEMVRQLG